jgi:hypothetical protein
VNGGTIKDAPAVTDLLQSISLGRGGASRMGDTIVDATAADLVHGAGRNVTMLQGSVFGTVCNTSCYGLCNYLH